MRARLLPVAVIAALAGCDPVPSADAGRDAGADDVGIVDAPRGSDTPMPDAAPPDAALEDVGRDAPETGSRIHALVALLAASPPDIEDIEMALHDVAWSEGWPLHEGDRWLFATAIYDAPPTVHFTSHLNGWSTTSHPAMRSATGVHYWVVLDDAELEAAPEGAQYKWLVGSEDHRAPLEATAYGFDDFGRFGWVRPDPARSHLEQFPQLISAHLEARRAIRAYLPAGFSPRSAAALSLRTLIVHDGQNVFHPDAPWGGWRIDETLEARGADDVIVLAIDNAEDRFDAYTHVADDIGGVDAGGRVDDYLALVFDEALPFFRDRYGLATDPRSIAVMGSSLGGLATLLAAARRSEPFACGAAMSPTVGWGSFAPGATDSLITHWPSDVGHGDVAIYLDSGGGGGCEDSDGDGVMDDGDDSDNYCVTAQMRDVLDGLGYDFGVDLSHWHEPGASHDEAAWAARVDRALDACTAMGWSAP